MIQKADFIPEKSRTKLVFLQDYLKDDSLDELILITECVIF